MKIQHEKIHFCADFLLNLHPHPPPPQQYYSTTFSKLNVLLGNSRNLQAGSSFHFFQIQKYVLFLFSVSYLTLLLQVHNPYMKDETFMRKNMQYIGGSKIGLSWLLMLNVQYWTSFYLESAWNKFCWRKLWF